MIARDMAGKPRIHEMTPAAARKLVDDYAPFWNEGAPAMATVDRSIPGPQGPSRSGSMTPAPPRRRPASSFSTAEAGSWAMSRATTGSADASPAMADSASCRSTTGWRPSTSFQSPLTTASRRCAGSAPVGRSWGSTARVSPWPAIPPAAIFPLLPPWACVTAVGRASRPQR